MREGPPQGTLQKPGDVTHVINLNCHFKMSLFVFFAGTGGRREISPVRPARDGIQAAKQLKLGREAGLGFGPAAIGPFTPLRIGERFSAVFKLTDRAESVRGSGFAPCQAI